MPTISTLKEDSSYKKKINPKIIWNQTTSSTIDAWTRYIYSLRFLVYKQKYPKRSANFLLLEIFLEYSNGRLAEDVCAKAQLHHKRMQTGPSIRPKEISICKYEEILMSTVDDTLEVLDYGSTEDM